MNVCVEYLTDFITGECDCSEKNVSLNYSMLSVQVIEVQLNHLDTRQHSSVKYV